MDITLDQIEFKAYSVPQLDDFSKQIQELDYKKMCEILKLYPILKANKDKSIFMITMVDCIEKAIATTLTDTQRLRMCMFMYGFTQKEIATICKVSQQVICKSLQCSVKKIITSIQKEVLR